MSLVEKLPLALSGDAFAAKGLLISLVLCLPGYKRIENFVTYGYGLSVAAQFLLTAYLINFKKITPFATAHALAVFLYGIRLTGFMFRRDYSEAYKRFQANRTSTLSKKGGGPPKLPFHIICSVLYMLLYLPSLYTIRAAPDLDLKAFGPAQGFLGLAFVALLLEALADEQKSRHKMSHPDSFIDTGLFRFSRHPNYFAEVLFWTTHWASAAAAGAFRTEYQWIYGCLGVLQMCGIMFQATNSLEKRQAEKYAGSEYDRYVSATPVFLPGAPKLKARRS